jgi:hypothetical protein
MSNKTHKGKITFINHEKHYATIEYTVNEKKKSVNGNISEQEQKKLKAAGTIKQIHHFHTGDDVSFILTPTPKGDKIVASNICFLYNNALDNMLNKAATENKFIGYLKKTDDGYFVKETDSYIFFPLIISPWEIPPAEIGLNEPVIFQLDNISKSGKASASLYKKQFIPAYHTAMRLFKNNTIIDAVVCKVTPHGIIVNVVDNAIQGKIKASDYGGNTNVKIGDIIKIKITYLSSSKIIIEKV